MLEVDGKHFDGVDLFLFHPHTDPNASDDDIKRMADQIAEAGFKVGSLVAPVWPGTVGGCAFGSEEDRDNLRSRRSRFMQDCRRPQGKRRT